MDPLNLVLAMAKDWTDPVVVRDAPDRAPDVIRQLIEQCEALRGALEAILAEPYGCSLCDYGTPRNPAKGHQPDCAYDRARQLLEGR